MCLIYMQCSLMLLYTCRIGIFGDDLYGGCGGVEERLELSRAVSLRCL